MFHQFSQKDRVSNLPFALYFQLEDACAAEGTVHALTYSNDNSNVTAWLLTHYCYYYAYALEELKLHTLLIVDSGVHPASYSMGTEGFFPEVKRSGREADHSLQTSAEVKEMWIYTSAPLYAFVAYCLIS
jgi:hypothetical protein